MSAILRAGYARIDITPDEPVPLAGMVGLHERLSTGVRDRIYVRAAALEQGETRVALVSADLLTPAPGFREAVLEALGGRPGEELLLACTHSHSTPGGYWSDGPARLFMGKERSELRASLVEAVARSVREAEADLAPARPLRGGAVVTAATGNRRAFRGPVDEELGLIRLEVKGQPPIDLVAMAGHPVIGSEREPTMISADYPGALMTGMEEAGSRPLFFLGAAAGTSILFPEFDQGMDRQIALVREILLQGVRRAEESLAPAGDGSLGSNLRDVPLGRVRLDRIRPAPGVSWLAGETLMSPLLVLWRRMVRSAYARVDSAPVHAVFLGDAAIVGFPAEVGPTVTRKARALALDSGLARILPVSHCDSYVGYYHMPEDYLVPAAKGYQGLALYENAMAFFGENMGPKFLDAAARLFEAR